MSKILVVGGTGYAGSAVVAEASSRGHLVSSLSRGLPTTQLDGVTYITGNVTDTNLLAEHVANSDVVISTLSPRGELDGRIREIDSTLADLARTHGARLIVVGGFSSLRAAEGQPNGVDGGHVPAEFLGEATQMNDVLTDLKAASEGLNWTFVSPAQAFGSYVPGEDLGHYRVGGDVALFDEDGNSAISGADFARGIVDRIDESDYLRAHISLAY